MRHTKIIGTLGPASESPAMIRALLEAGMDVARLNFSHGSFEYHARTVRHIREQADTLGRAVAILQDLPGPKLRIGALAREPVTLERGNRFVLAREGPPGDCSGVTLPDASVYRAVRPGDSLYLDDGALQLRVITVTNDRLDTEVIVGGPLRSHKGLTVPSVALGIAAITERDREAARFGAEIGVDWVAASFVQTANDVEVLRAELKAAQAATPIIAKIEKHEAVENIDAIIATADGVMVARGDLGVEMDVWDVPTIQKMIIRQCNRRGKPVITATQMLESMIHNRRPTRAEATDVANAILDGTDCLMLSGETAIGRYPIETVAMMHELAETAERALDHAAILQRRRTEVGHSTTDAISGATVEIASTLNATAILTATTSGSTARMISRYRPAVPIISVTTLEETYRELALVWGVVPVMAPRAGSLEDALENTVRAAKRTALIRPGDTVVLTGGVPSGEPGNTNLIRVVDVD